MRKDTTKLIREMADKEADFRKTTFVAPCLPRGLVRVRVAGLVCSFRFYPRHFEGWAILRAKDHKTAVVTDTANPSLVDDYCKHLTPLRCRIVTQLEGSTWLAYPNNESDMKQKVGRAEPFKLHLTRDAGLFDTAIAVTDGAVWWYSIPDMTSDPVMSHRLRQAFETGKDPSELKLSGLTPEMLVCYQLAAAKAKEFAERRTEDRLRDALSMAGGQLSYWQDRGESWLVRWTTRDGEEHNSVVEKRDLTVTSAGICLSGRDRRFDLHTLVRVVENRPSWMRR